MNKFRGKMKSMLKGSFQHILHSRRWLLVYVVFVVLPVTYFFYSYQQRSLQMVEEEVTRSMLQTMKQSAINLEFHLERAKDTSDSLFMSANLYDILENSEQAYPIDIMKNLKALIDIAQTNGNVFRVRLFLDGNQLYARERINIFPLETLEDRSWYLDVLEARGSIVWIGAYREHYVDSKNKLVFSNARLLRDPASFEQFVGVLVVDWTEDSFRDILTPIQLAEGQAIYILDQYDQMIWHSDPTLMGQALDADKLSVLSQSGEGIGHLSTGKEQRTLLHTKLATTGWKLVADVPTGEVFAQAHQMNRTSSIVTLMGGALLLLLLIFVIMAYVIREMNRSVQAAIRSIHREGINNLETGSEEVKRGSFNMLERSVDHMVYKVKGLMEETYQSKMLEREAQLRALQAQINPHFLYNTLDTINWIAVGRDAQDISQMITQLAKYFRLSLSKGQDHVRLKDELELAKTYLEIQQARFPSLFAFSIEAEKQMLDYTIPKLTLQPIVENALLHGIRKLKQGTIHIEASLVGDELLIQIQDDGVGMDETKAAGLLIEPQARGDAVSQGSYGLYNVHERIRLFAGDAYGLQIISKPGKGTMVQIRMRAVKLESRS